MLLSSYILLGAHSVAEDAFWLALDQLVETSTLVIDRPRGSTHPRYADFQYPLSEHPGGSPRDGAMGMNAGPLTGGELYQLGSGFSPDGEQRRRYGSSHC